MRVVVTGTGLVCSLGIGSETVYRRLCAGERGLRHIDLFDTEDQRATLCAQVEGVIVPEGGIWSRATAFAALAAREALDASHVDPRVSRVGLVVGGTTAGMFENEVWVAQMTAGLRPRESWDGLRSHPLSSTCDALDHACGPFVRSRTIASACASGATAIVLGMSWLALDESLDAVVVGGTDGICRLTLSGFNALGAIDPEPCRPFDRSRRGLNLGEGAGMLVIERRDHAAQRGARVICDLAGGALGAEAHHITNPEPDGKNAALVIRHALEQAGLSPTDVDYVNAHGTATPLNDRAETLALRASLGDALPNIWVSSSKAQVGHTLAAAGAIEAVISAHAIATRTLPPTVGLVDVDPDCDLRHVKVATKVDRVRAVISSSFGFGGMDGAIILTEPGLTPDRSRDIRRVVVTGTAVLEPKAGEALVSEADLTLDPNLARRYDRSAKLAAAVVKAALGDRPRPRTTGVVLGSAFGAVDESAAFVHRLSVKGPRLASPFDFPNLVPSSPVGHASIYNHLHGPAACCADLRTSGEAAFETAWEHVAVGDADAFVAGALSVRSELIDEVFAPLFGERPRVRRESAIAIVLEAKGAGNALAEVGGVFVGRGTLDLPAPGDGAVQLVARDHDKTSWGNARVLVCADRLTSNEGIGAQMIAIAVTMIARREADSVLVMSRRDEMVHGILLITPKS